MSLMSCWISWRCEGSPQQLSCCRKGWSRVEDMWFFCHNIGQHAHAVVGVWVWLRAWKCECVCCKWCGECVWVCGELLFEYVHVWWGWVVLWCGEPHWLLSAQAFCTWFVYQQPWGMGWCSCHDHVSDIVNVNMEWYVTERIANKWQETVLLAFRALLQ